MGEDTTPAPQPSATLLPPTRTQAPVTAAAAASRAPLPPFTGGRPRAVDEPPIWLPPADDPASQGPVPPPPELDEPQPIGFGHAVFDEATLAGARAAFEADSASSDTAVQASAGVAPEQDEEGAPEAEQEAEAGEPFPLDAFIVPPAALGARADDAAAARQLDLVADRLADFAFELRAHGSTALQNRLHHGDRLDTVVAAVLAGYLAGLDAP